MKTLITIFALHTCILSITAQDLIPFSENKKCGYKDQTGKIVVEAKYDYVGKFSDGLGKVNMGGTVDKELKKIAKDLKDIQIEYVEGGKWGYVDVNGKEIIPLEYDNLCSFTEGIVHGETNGKAGFLDKKGAVVIPFTFEKAKCMKEGLAPVLQNGKWGYINSSGKLIIDYTYDGANTFSEGISSVKIGDKWGGIDLTGKLVLPAKYDEALYFYKGKANVKMDGKEARIDKKGEVLLKLESFKDANGKFGIKASNGEIIVPGKYDELGYFHGNFIRANINGKWGFINDSGEEVIKMQYENVGFLKFGVAPVKMNGKWGLIDSLGNKVIDFIYDQSDYSFDEDAKLLEVAIGKKYGMINTEGIVVVPIKYLTIGSFKDGLAKVSLGADENYKKGYINMKGEEVIPAIYDDADSFENGKAKVKLGKKKFYIDTKGNETK